VRKRRIAAAAIAVLLAGALATYVAGEQNEVVVVRTLDRDGAAQDTKVWVVDYQGVPWVRVANPRREWFQRLSQNPQALNLYRRLGYRDVGTVTLRKGLFHCFEKALG
jgi:hypothetical protein